LWSCADLDRLCLPDLAVAFLSGTKRVCYLVQQSVSDRLDRVVLGVELRDGDLSIGVAAASESLLRAVEGEGPVDQAVLLE
jgi:uncharacterized membrane protein